MTCPEARQCLGGHDWSRLPGWRPTEGKAGQYRARCPAHDDHRTSLSVGIDGHARVVWYCHAGCSPADVRAALVRAGIHDRCLHHVPGQRTEDELVSALLVRLPQEQPFRR